MCFGAKIISQGISLTLKVKVPGLYLKDLSWGCFTSSCAHLYLSNGPLFTPEFHFRSISREQIEII